MNINLRLKKIEQSQQQHLTASREKSIKDSQSAKLDRLTVDELRFLCDLHKNFSDGNGGFLEDLPEDVSAEWERIKLKMNGKELS